VREGKGNIHGCILSRSAPPAHKPYAQRRERDSEAYESPDLFISILLLVALGLLGTKGKHTKASDSQTSSSNHLNRILRTQVQLLEQLWRDTDRFCAIERCAVSVSNLVIVARNWRCVGALEFGHLVELLEL
jgi:hypothetical protein